MPGIFQFRKTIHAIHLHEKSQIQRTVEILHAIGTGADYLFQMIDGTIQVVSLPQKPK